MRPSLIIPRLRAQCPIFAGRVAGAMSFGQVRMATSFATPNAFVLLDGISPTGEDSLASLDQQVEARLSVWVAVTSAADAEGFDASQRLYQCFMQVRSALLGWSPDPTLYAPISIDGLILADGEETYVRARAWGRCDISATAMVRDLS